MVGTTAALIAAGIGGGTSIFGGLLGSRAANKAARIQAESAEREARATRDVLGQVNPQIGAAATAAADEARAAALAGQTGVTGAAGQVRADALGANELLAPYTGLGAQAAGSLAEFMGPGGEGQRTFTAADMAAYDPGYQFRLQEAQRAVESSAAARGGALGGGTLKALLERSQNLASSEFGAAHDRFRQQQQDRYNRLFGTTELGMRGAGQAGQNLLTAGAAGLRGAEFGGELGLRGAETAGRFGTRGTEVMAANALDTQRSISDLMTSGAAARAAGTVGSANAWQGALGGVANAAGGLAQNLTLNDLFKNPALTPQASVYNLPSVRYRPPINWG